MRQMGLTEKNLCPTTTINRVANNEVLTVLGMIPVTVTVVGHLDKKSVQALFIAKELTRLFVSRNCLLELGSLPRSWPYPQKNTESCLASTTEVVR